MIVYGCCVYGGLYPPICTSRYAIQNQRFVKYIFPYENDYVVLYLENSIVTLGGYPIFNKMVK